MRRRLLISALGCWSATGLLAQQEEAARPHHKISAGELRRAVATRFPVRFAVPGLLDVQVQVPSLQLLPARQRLGGTFAAKIGDLAERRTYHCELDLLFALRWESSDRTLRARDIEVRALRSPALPAEAAQAWQVLLQNIARSTLAEVVLHQFSPGELQMPDLLGLQPDEITIEDDGVQVWFAPKTRG